MVRTCVECDNFFDTSLGVHDEMGVCLLHDRIVREDDPSCEEFEDEQGGE